MSQTWTPKVEIENTVDQLYACGDWDHHLLVRRGPLSLDTDASWRQVMAEVQEHNMVPVCEALLPAGSRVPFDVRATLYMTPQLKFYFSDSREGRALVEAVANAVMGSDFGDAAWQWIARQQ